MTERLHLSKRRDVLRLGSLTGLSSLVLLIGVTPLARGASILAVRMWPSKDYSRVTIESDREIKARQFLLADPPRVAIDIEGMELLPALRELVAKVKPEDPNISGIRVGQNAPGVVRLVIDLKQAVQPQVFTLAPVSTYQHRLVFDLYPQKVLDPLEALIAERLKDSGKPANSTSLPPSPSVATSGSLSSLGSSASSAAARNRPAGTDPLDELIAGHSAQAATSAAAPPPKQSSASKTDRLVIVALDPGHGGEDPGAIGPGFC